MVPSFASWTPSGTNGSSATTSSFPADPSVLIGTRDRPGSVDSFKAFVKKKTEQIRKDYGCHAVEYSVETENGQVRLKAKAKV